MEKRWTRRQLSAVLAWLDMEWDRPGRSDYYLMQIAFEVFRGAHIIPDDKRDEWGINRFRLPFGQATVTPTNGSSQGSAQIPTGQDGELSDERVAHITAMAKARWAARLGMVGDKMPQGGGDGGG